MKKPPEGGSLTGAVASLILRQVGARWLDQIEPCMRCKISQDDLYVLALAPENGLVGRDQLLFGLYRGNVALLGEVTPLHAAIPLA
ncbi:hypothetical protein DES43_15210 [Aquamicrobium defluvii]|uniref:Uncharacterized protein n=1 Tax=Aquamicrobium defluvii TaxID=69279 RepID=A0A4R6Y4W8_9HYPH|nr:hypothetical protein DES43_15210 [Aquamicrobium defluvii]